MESYYQLVWENLTRLWPQMGFLGWYSSPFFPSSRNTDIEHVPVPSHAVTASLRAVVWCSAEQLCLADPDPDECNDTNLSEDPDQEWQDCGVEEKCRVKLTLSHRPGCMWGRKGQCQAIKGWHDMGTQRQGLEPDSIGKPWHSCRGRIRPSASYLISLNFSFLICKMGLITSTWPK